MNSTLSEKTLTQKITINSSVAKVWDALTNTELTKEYMFDCFAISDWKEGSPLEWKGAHDGKLYVKGYILKIIPLQLLQFTRTRILIPGRSSPEDCSFHKNVFAESTVNRISLRPLE